MKSASGLWQKAGGMRTLSIKSGSEADLSSSRILEFIDSPVDVAPDDEERV